MPRLVQQRVEKDSVTELYINAARYALNSQLSPKKRCQTLKNLLGIASKNPLNELTERYLTYIEHNPNYTSQKKRELVESAFQILVHKLPPYITFYFQGFLDGFSFLQGFRERYGLKIYKKQQRRNFKTTFAKKFTRRKKVESTQIGEEYQQPISQHRPQSRFQKRILIYDENFNEVSLESWEAARSYIRHCCYLTARQLQKLTGLPHGEIVRRAVELRTERKVIKGSRRYFMNADIYSKMSEIKQSGMQDAETQNQGKPKHLEEIIDPQKKKDQERIPLQHVIYQAGFPKPQDTEILSLCEKLGIQIDIREQNPTLPKHEAKELLVALKKERITGQPTYQG